MPVMEPFRPQNDFRNTLHTSHITRTLRSMTSERSTPSPYRFSISFRTRQFDNQPQDLWEPDRTASAIGGGTSTGKGILIGMLSAVGSVMLVLSVFAIIYFFRFTSRGRILLDRIGGPGEFDDEQAFAREEAEALEEMDDIQRAEYMRAKAFVQSNPPESTQTDISLSQFLAIQEKGVSAWEFEPELEIANCFVEARTEIEFFDSECSVQTNLPVPKQNEVYYWEAKIYDKPDTTTIGIGMTTKPYPLFRLPGYHKTSVAYLSPGHRRFNQPFNPHATYGPPFVRGDVVGVGYRPRSGTVFFTRNGKKLDDVTHTLKTQNLFPTVGATGPATVHVNFGQMGFVFIEANVKKWGLAPLTGSLAPPPPYGSEQGSILLEGGQYGVAEGQGWLSPTGSGWSPHSPHNHQSGHGHARTRSAMVRAARGQHQHPPTSPGPLRSPTDISLAQLSIIDAEDNDGHQGLARDDYYEIQDPGEGTSAALVSTSRNTNIPAGVPSIGISRNSLVAENIASVAPPMGVPSAEVPLSESIDGPSSLDAEEVPPPEYSSPLPQSVEWQAREAQRDYFGADGGEAASGSQTEAIEHREGEGEASEDEDHRRDGDEEALNDEERERRKAARRHKKRGKRRRGERASRNGDDEVEGEHRVDERPSPPIPSYDVAVGNASPPHASLASNGDPEDRRRRRRGTRP